MKKSKLIVFEGIDNSGKTTISKELQKILTKDSNDLRVHFMSMEGPEKNDSLKSLALDWHSTWAWNKEPTFSTEQADKLNNGDMDGNEREVLFLESRLERQKDYARTSTVLDRYLWTGLAYAKNFSQECYPFLEKLYVNYNIFKKPDLMIFLDTPVETCHEREPSVSIERLNNLRDAYLDTKGLFENDIRIEIVDGSGTVEEITARCLELVKEEIFTEDSFRIQSNPEFPLKEKENNDPS